MVVNYVPSIVLSGGPCAGKSTILTFLCRKLSEYGYTVFAPPEAATEFKKAGAKPAVVGNVAFQRELFGYILDREDRFRRMAEELQQSPSVILLDRSVMDAEAYLTEEEMSKLIRSSGRLSHEIYARYHGVLFVNTLAETQPHLYTCEDNSAREESLEEAIELNARTRRAWKRNTNFYVIDNNGTEKDLQDESWKAISMMLKLPT